MSYGRSKHQKQLLAAQRRLVRYWCGSSTSPEWNTFDALTRAELRKFYVGFKKSKLSLDQYVAVQVLENGELPQTVRYMLGRKQTK